jgi:hypothetical protein
VSDPKELSDQVREHFQDFPRWRANRTARNEVRDAFNAGVLLTSIAGGNDVQALDGRADSGKTDPDCAARDGQIYNPIEAMKETDHPNGTLGWRAVPAEFTVEVVEDDDPNLPRARFDTDTMTVHFSRDVSDEVRGKYLKAVVERL